MFDGCFIRNENVFRTEKFVWFCEHWKRQSFDFSSFFKRTEDFLRLLHSMFDKYFMRKVRFLLVCKHWKKQTLNLSSIWFLYPLFDKNFFWCRANRIWVCKHWKTQAFDFDFGSFEWTFYTDDRFILCLITLS